MARIGRPPSRPTDGDLLQCSVCKQMLHYDNFYEARARKGATGRTSLCKVCQKEYARKYNKTYKRKKQLETRGERLEKVYGITLDEFERMVEKQGGECAICDRPINANHDGCQIVVDHDHNTKAIRGILCKKCNCGIGLFNDSTALLVHATAYLHDANRRYTEERESVKFVRRSR